ncbi:MAG: FKBP-type peptidyl-prolyl cis-trans isomerase [Eubacterium sp.]
MFKKVLAVVLSSAMALALIGCGTKTSVGEGEVKLGEYKGLVVYHDDVEVTDDAYQQTVDYLLSQDTTTELVKKGTVKKDSTVNVDYVGKIEVDGKKVKFEGGEATEQNISLSSDAGSYIDGFVSSLKGHKVGDKFTEKLKFPKTYTQTTTVNKKTIELAGKDVWFTFTINGIQKSTTPELTDKYAKEKFGIYGVTDVKSFKTYVKNQMRISNIMNKVWSDFVDTCEVVSYDKEEKESLKKTYETNFEAQLQQQYQADLQTYLEACSMSEEDWDKQVTEQVESSLKEKMIIKAIAEKENLIPEGEDYKKEAETLAEQNSASVEELESQYGKDEVEYAIIYQRVQKFIADNVKEKEGSEPTTAAETTKAAETTAAETTAKAK